MPASFSLPLPNSHAVSSSHFDMRSFVSGSEFDWLSSGSALMDVDADAQRRILASHHQHSSSS